MQVHLTQTMKTLLPIALIALSSALNLCAQGTVTFANSSSSVVTNGLTGSAVASSAGCKVALFAAVDGTTDEALFTQVSGTVSLGTPASGRYSGGTVTSSPVVPAGAYGMFQVRAWESAYGTNYASAAAALPMNGRSALLGKSSIIRVSTGNQGATPPKPAAQLVDFGLQGFTMTSQPVSSLSVNDIVVAEGTNGTVTANFAVALLPPSSSAVTVDYATTDGSALAGSDYTATSGSLSFSAGETNKTVSVTVTADGPAEPDETFTLNLSNASGAPITKAMGTCTITEIRVTGISVDVAVSFNTVAGHHYVLEKSDDLTTWSPVTGAENVAGTGSVVTKYDQGAGCAGLRIYRARLLD